MAGGTPSHPPGADPGDPAGGTVSQWLAEVPFFAGLPADDLREIAAAGATASLPADRLVFGEGDVADRLYVILEGRARIFKTGADGQELTLAWPGVGDFFGEMALLDGGLRSAGVVTLADCRFFTLDRADFLARISGEPELLTRLMTELTGKIREHGERALREEMEAERLRVETELQRHRSLSRVVAGVAHELNTPLGIARTAASVLRSAVREPMASGTGLPVDDMVEAVDLLERNILRAHKLVQDFKSVSVGQISDQRDTHNLLDVVSEVANLYRIEAKRAGLTVELRDELGGDDATWVGYRGYLSQVLLNLLTNAERYAYPDGSGGRVEISVSVDDADTSRFRVRVRDFGAGMDPETLDRAFEPFYTTGRAKGGTGLGLAIVHNLVTAGLGGSVRIASGSGQGTDVRVAVPRIVPERDPAGSGSPS